jgi:hypothetical protein
VTPTAGSEGHTAFVSTPQYEATLRAVARIDHAIRMLLSPEAPEPRSSKWTPELTHRVVEGMQACRWFLATGFEPPEQFGSWLRRILQEEGLGPSSNDGGDFYGSRVWHAANAVDQLREDWQPDWSM